MRRDHHPDGIALRGFTLVEILTALGVISTAVLLTLPALQAARAQANRASCVYNLKLIGLAMHNYESANGAFPMSCVRGEGHGNGHSVFTALTPYMEQQEVYNAYNFYLENSHVANSTSVRTRIAAFLCPENPNDKNTSEQELKDLKLEGDLLFAKTHYGANWGGGRDERGKDFREAKGNYRGVLMTVVDPDGAVLAKDGKPLARNVTLAEITDGTSKTVAFAEKRNSFGWAVGGWGGSEFDVHTSPVYQGDDVVSQKVLTGSFHDDRVNTLFVDGSVRRLESTLEKNLWYALITRNGGDEVDLNAPGIVTATTDQSRREIARRDEAAKASETLFNQIKNSPAVPSKSERNLGIYILDTRTGEVVLAASETDPGLDHCGSPSWSGDGTRILFDAQPKDHLEKTRIKSLEIKEGRLAVKDLGPGNCPAPSPSDDRVIFLLNPDQMPGEEIGVWLLQGDGSDRRKLGGYGRPKWSPDGHQFLIISFGTPCDVTLIDDRLNVASGKLGTAEELYSIPSWAGDSLIVAVAAPERGKVADSVCLFDVNGAHAVTARPALWEVKDGPAITPSDPVYSSVTNQCIFVGREEGGTALYAVDQAKPHVARRLENGPLDRMIQDLAFSPDGRYLLFTSSRGEPAK